MPQPIISGVPLTCQFGGLALPNGQGAMAQINLNDGTNWQWQDFQGDDNYVQLTPAQLVWRARSTVIARDRKARVLTLPMRYQEASSAPSAALGAQIALLDQAGQQQLTFDNSTFILANYAGLKKRTMLKKFSPFYWSFDLEFLCPEPYFRDLASTSVGSVKVTSMGFVGGPAVLMPAPPQLQAQMSGVMWPSPYAIYSQVSTPVTTAPVAFSIVYAGSVFAEPVFTLTVPPGNSVSSFALSNTMSGETLVATFPGGLATSTLWTIAIDCGAWTVKDQLGNSYDVTGSFPNLYPPAGTSNPFTASVTTITGQPTGVTLAASYQNRWLI